ncbi:SDR family oxidoreductase [Vibrio sp. Of14-4]|uniref:SDR family oxidoreductase n=1 Tax=Vibrio tetraodonis subsp. pristinus TaxID=2695891 RepID=A0A6L8LWC3_9VIBR|nr:MULTISPECIES: SDR family oxidoreductase [Vibrio]MCG7490798.1 SDR family oxidoreductase [Vibrio sp. Of14-4]MYM60394.1 SDR family oxidoreductase [Vibrio tetraodonis subsp. pristinus]
MELKHSVIAITGAGQGLGQMMATTLAKAGAELALLDVNDEALLNTKEQCNVLGVKALTYKVNVTNEQQVEQVFSDIVRDFGQLDGLINNAGILRDGLLIKVKDDEMTKMSLEQFNSVIDVNLNGTFLCGREAAAQMINTQRNGVIINISSVARAGNIGQSNYAASKAAVATLATTWGKELARYGIRAAAIAPGVIETSMTGGMKPEARERLEKMVPVGRMGSPEEIAQTAKFIFENDYVNARVFEVDGGIFM